MADVFISYSRKDEAFVKQLHGALEESGRDAWVDWQDIAPTAEFMEEIYKGIEGVNTFVFILSPDSVTSEVCNLEVAHALKNQKRIVPINFREFDPKAIPEDLPVRQMLNRINWLRYDENDPFEVLFNALVAAIETDLAWVQQHTNLLQKAKEWEQSEKNNSFLLQGDELEAAQQWLQQKISSDQEQRPTDLHVGFINQSRQYETSRRRKLMTGVVGALVVMTVLAVVAFIFFGVARENEQEANAQREIAEKNEQDAKNRLADYYWTLGSDAKKKNNVYHAAHFYAQSVSLDNRSESLKRCARTIQFIFGQNFISDIIKTDTGYIVSYN